jgi:hypothetical protein
MKFKKNPNSKGTLPSPGATDTRPDARLAPTHREISNQAEELWRQKGCPENCDEEIWLEAERFLRNRPASAEARCAAVVLDNPNYRSVSGDVMNELDGEYPSPSGRETTSL